MGVRSTRGYYYRIEYVVWSLALLALSAAVKRKIYVVLLRPIDGSLQVLTP